MMQSKQSFLNQNAVPLGLPQQSQSNFLASSFYSMNPQQVAPSGRQQQMHQMGYGSYTMNFPQEQQFPSHRSFYSENPLYLSNQQPVLNPYNDSKQPSLPLPPTGFQNSKFYEFQSNAHKHRVEQINRENQMQQQMQMQMLKP